jgi:hypothetical protein
MINEKIDKTLKSLDGLKRAEAHTYLYQTIIHRMETRKSAEFAVRIPIVRLAAVCLVLIALNLFSWVHMYEGKKPDVQNAMVQLYSNFFNSSSIVDF